MDRINELTRSLKKIAKIDNLFISQIDIKDDEYRKIQILGCDYCVYIPKECDYNTTYLIKQIYEIVLKEYREKCGNEEYMACFKGMVKELLDASKSYACEGYVETKSFEFLGTQNNYAIIKNDMVIFNKNINKPTLETSILKLKKQEEFNMLVKEGEVYGCKIQNYKAILSCDSQIDDITKSALKVRLIFLNKLYENEVFLGELKNVNSVLEELVKARTKEIETKNEMLEEEKNKLSEANYKLTELNKKLAKLSKTDPLTRLSNRRGLKEKFKLELKKVQGNKALISLIMCDIDFFKSVNDTYGHDCGDKVLIKIADLFRKYLREEDVIARYGGEEFIIILPESNFLYSISVAEKLRSAVENEVFEYNNNTFHITMSFGLFNCSNEKDYTEIIKKADEALYKAKQKGRNQVISLS